MAIVRLRKYSDNVARYSVRVPPPPPQPDYLIAFFLQISNETLPQFPRLLNRLHHPETLYVVHFD